MKKILILLFVLSLNSHVFGAGSDSSSDNGSDSSETSLYDQAVKLLKKASYYDKVHILKSYYTRHYLRLNND